MPLACFPGSLALVCASVLATAAPVRAQLIHLTFSAATSTQDFTGNVPGYYWDTGGAVTTNTPVTVDLYYDPATMHATGEPGAYMAYTPTDPAKNYWRVRFTEIGSGLSFDVTHPLNAIEVFSNGLWATSTLSTPDRNVTFDLSATFATDLPSYDLPSGTPVPPLSPDFASYFSLTGDSLLYGLAGLAEGDVRAGFDHASGPSFVAVPEPATFAVGGLLLLGVAMVCRRRQSNAA